MLDDDVDLLSIIGDDPAANQARAALAVDGIIDANGGAVGFLNHHDLEKIYHENKSS